MGEHDDRFSEDEVALILRRAAEIQPGRSVALSEVEAIAEEVGIDKALVRRAAADVRRGTTEPPVPVRAGAFGPTRVVFERSASGAVDPSMWGDLVAEIRRHVSSPGRIEEVGKELIWSSRSSATEAGDAGRDIRVIVTPRRDKTLVRVEEKTSGLAGGLFGGIMGGAGAGGLGWILPVCIAALEMPILIPFFIAAWVYATYRFAKLIYDNILSTRRPQLQAIADGVADLATELAAAPPAQPHDT